ncbi:B3/B4 domain-containing protein, partial [Pseudomonas aeruginosa]
MPSIDPVGDVYNAISVQFAIPVGGEVLAAYRNGELHADGVVQVHHRVDARQPTVAQRTPCSAEALRKRALRDGGLPSIDPVVDLYNAISVQFAIPVGGENLAAYAGTPRLVVADGSETFDTLKNGEAVDESPDPVEVVWRDDLGVTCRCWNWLQGVRTRL